MEADLGVTEMAFAGNQGIGDETLLVRFFYHPRKDKTKSREAGRDIFVDAEYIEIMQPGNKDSVVRRPVSDIERQRFPQHYAKFKARAADRDQIVGTRLSEWPGVSASQVRELEYINVHTVEQLAAMADSNAQGIMGVNLLKEKAKAYLDASETQKSAEELRTLRDENQKLTERLDKMQAALDEMKSDDDEPAQKPRRRRRQTEDAA